MLRINEQTPMGFLGIDLKSFVKKIAPKVVKATVNGGSQQSRDLLRNTIEAPIFEPVFEKFGKDFETGAKIAGSIAAGAATGGLGSLFGTTALKGSAGSLLKNIMPAAKDINWGSILTKGFDLVKDKLSGGGSPSSPPPPAPGGGFDFKAIPWYVYAIAVALLFGKQLKKLLR